MHALPALPAARRVLACVLALALWPVAAAARGVPREQCFPFEQLSPEVRAEAERLLLKALDSEAHFTLIGGLKPVSSGFASFEIDVRDPSWQVVDRAREAIASWRCGETVAAGVLAFARTHDGKRPLQAFVAHVPRVAALVHSRRAFFGALGVSPASSPAEVVLAVEHTDEASRFRGYGWLFGYPDAAIDFFVGAWVFQQYTGWLVPRDFRSVPTFGRETNAFVWAVPKGQEDTDAARRIEAAAAPVLAEYRWRRAKYLAPGGQGVLALVRDWFCDARGACDPSRATPRGAADRVPSGAGVERSHLEHERGDSDDEQQRVEARGRPVDDLDMRVAAGSQGWNRGHPPGASR